MICRGYASLGRTRLVRALQVAKLPPGLGGTMGIMLFSAAVAASSMLAFGTIEAGVALGALAGTILWLGGRTFGDS